jgi:hypothetical protein
MPVEPERRVKNGVRTVSVAVIGPMLRRTPHFRCGSKADLTAPKSDFRFTPESGLKSDIAPCPKSAIRRHGPIFQLHRSFLVQDDLGQPRPAP